MHVTFTKKPWCAHQHKNSSQYAFHKTYRGNRRVEWSLTFSEKLSVKQLNQWAPIYYAIKQVLNMYMYTQKYYSQKRKTFQETSNFLFLTSGLFLPLQLSVRNVVCVKQSCQLYEGKWLNSFHVSWGNVIDHGDAQRIMFGLKCLSNNQYPD